MGFYRKKIIYSKNKFYFKYNLDSKKYYFCIETHVLATKFHQLEHLYNQYLYWFLHIKIIFFKTKVHSG